MIRQTSEAFLLDEEHEEHSQADPSLRVGPRRKWVILEDPAPRRLPTRAWSQFSVASDIRTTLTERSSDEELFQKAAEKVDQRIQMDRKILGGAPCIAGTRIPVYAILQLVEAGYSHKRILKSFPSLSAADLEAALRFSAIVMER